MKITDEMIEVAAKAAWKKDYPKGGSVYRTYESTPEHDKRLYRQDARIILTAALPLVRAQIKEEAVRELKAYEEENPHDDDYLTGINNGIKCCIAVIRNLP